MKHKQITLKQALGMYIKGEPFSMMVTRTGDFMDMRAVDAKLYMDLLLDEKKMMFFVDVEEKKGIPHPSVKVKFRNEKDETPLDFGEKDVVIPEEEELDQEAKLRKDMQSFFNTDLEEW